MFPQQQQMLTAHTKTKSDHYTPLSTLKPQTSSSALPRQQTNPQVLYDQLTSPPAYTGASARNADTSRAPRAVDFHSPATTRHDHRFVTSEQSYQQAPWLNRTSPHHDHVIPERRHSDHYNSLLTYPTTTPAYPHTSSHMSDTQTLECWNDRSTTSGSSRNWRTPPEGSLTSRQSGQRDHLSDLFPLLYANQLLSSYSSHQDNRHGDYYPDRSN